MKKVTKHWGNEIAKIVTSTIYELSFAFCFCNLLARVYKVRPLCSQHNKTFPAKLPQWPIAQFEIPATLPLKPCPQPFLL
jgi:hypothetical protein